MEKIKELYESIKDTNDPRTESFNKIIEIEKASIDRIKLMAETFDISSSKIEEIINESIWLCR